LNGGREIRWNLEGEQFVTLVMTIFNILSTEILIKKMIMDKFILVEFFFAYDVNFQSVIASLRDFFACVLSFNEFKKILLVCGF